MLNLIEIMQTSMMFDEVQSCFHAHRSEDWMHVIVCINIFTYTFALLLIHSERIGFYGIQEIIKCTKDIYDVTQSGCVDF